MSAHRLPQALRCTLQAAAGAAPRCCGAAGWGALAAAAATPTLLPRPSPAARAPHIQERSCHSMSTASSSSSSPTVSGSGGSTSSSGCGDWILLYGMRFHGRHGVLPEETRLGQPFVVDARLKVDLSRAGATDALEDTVSYADVYSDIRRVVEGPPCRLLEAVAARACDAVLSAHGGVREVVLRVRKLSIPGVPSVVESVGVEVHRRR